jgi:3-oxoacyl-[acyl-carrier protein] reductase
MANENSKVALVTGASRGIGAAIARRLAADGFAVIINYAGNRPPAEALVSELRERGSKAFAVQGDVSDPAQVKQLFDAGELAFGGIDVLVNNAGVMSLAPVAQTDDETFDRMVAINLKGTFNTLREATKRLRSGGRIVNFSSSVVGLHLPSYAAYAATKAGVEALTTILAKELRGRQITVNTVAPGPTATDLFLKGKSDELVEKMSKQAPLERLGQPTDIAAVVAFFVGADGAWINGQNVRANGGIV